MRFLTRDKIEALEVVINSIDKVIIRNEAMLRSFELLNLFLSNDYAYAVEYETKKIIWANKQVKEIFGDDVEGNLCFGAFSGGISICDFCKVEKAKLQPNVPFKWIHRNKLTGKVYLVEDTYLPNGINGFHGAAQFERAIDITHFYDDIKREFLYE